MDIYNKAFRDHSVLLKALAHPKRLEVIHLIREHSLTVGQIQEMLDLPQANLSQHLQILRLAGVVTTSKKGREVNYQLSHQNFIKASDLFRDILLDRTSDNQVAIDPVCGMHLSVKTAAFVHTHDKTDYFFCASKCLANFKKQPEKYINN